MSSRFTQNRDCEFFPCHGEADPEKFNCLFCYCPLYPLGDQCGGGYTYTEDGIKDCSSCLLPHQQENYDLICAKLSELVRQYGKKRTDSDE